MNSPEIKVPDLFRSLARENFGATETANCRLSDGNEFWFVWFPHCTTP